MSELLLEHEGVLAEPEFDQEFALLVAGYGATAVAHEVRLGDPDDEEDEPGSEENPETDDDEPAQPPMVRSGSS